MPILSQQSERVGSSDTSIKYIDAFAGPGIYENGEKGSPILALEAALNHSREFPVPVELVFIEEDADRFRVLETELSKFSTRVANSAKIRLAAPQCRDCRIVLGRMLDQCDRLRNKFGPALVFLDQFGYSAVPMDLIQRIMSHPQCEVLTYLFWRDLDRFITDPTKHAGITAAFGSDNWRPAIGLPGGGRERFMLQLYMKNLKQQAVSKYVWPFAMLDQNERLLYWLFFCTNNIRGLEEMKKAMWKVDQTGGFTFNDRDGFGQLKFLTAYTDDVLANDLARSLSGRDVRVGEIYEWVLTQTPAYKFKTALSKLFKSGTVKPVQPPKGWRPGTFPDDGMVLRFENSMFL